MLQHSKTKKSSRRLSIDEEDYLRRALDSEYTWKAMLKWMKSLEAQYLSKVIAYDLNKGPEGLVIEKARAEGVQSFVAAMQRERIKLLKPIKEA